MTSVLPICGWAVLFVVCYGHDHMFSWHRKYPIQYFMTEQSRIWFYATSRLSGDTECMIDTVENSTKKGVAFVRSRVNRSYLFDQDFYVRQMYGRSLGQDAMVVKKLSGLPEDDSIEMMTYTNPARTCAVFFVWSIKEPGKHWCDLRVKDASLWVGPEYPCAYVFHQPPCNGRRRALFTSYCQVSEWL